MKDGLLGFSGQTGQTPDDYDFRLEWLMSCPFNQIRLDADLKIYTQMHPDALKSFELVCAVPQGWHGEGTTCRSASGSVPTVSDPATRTLFGDRRCSQNQSHTNFR